MRKTILRGLEEGIFPGAVVCVARYGDPYFFEAHGYAETQPNERPMSLDMRFDIASLTEVVATLPAILRTVQMGKLSLADPIARYLPEFATGIDRHVKGQITCFDLLNHQSGLPAWRPFFLEARGVKAYLRALADTPLECEPGERVIRSDLGYMLLGFALERIWDRPLQDVCERLVFGPLDLTQTSFASGEGLPSELCVATEAGNEQERKQCAKHDGGEVRDFPWRGNVVCGEVLDGNAFYGLDGVSGHAGLFSTASDLNRFAEMWIRKGLYNRERFLDPTLITVATSCHLSKRENGGGCGWMSGGQENTLGEGVPMSGYGISDRSGVSIWCDPLIKVSAVVLTNASHPKARDSVATWRQALHKKIFAE
jgi:serine-type D-Ala-D-Ala carboxypeptidase